MKWVGCDTGSKSWKMEIILHIGTHKTGTTSIQDALRASFEQLLERGILFPEAGCPPGLSGQHMLSWYYQSNRQKKLPFPKPPVWEELYEEVSRYQPEKVILSAESFSSAKSAAVEKIRSELDQFSPYEISVILYLREPLSYLKSSYKQHIKNGKYAESFPSFVESHIQEVDYRSLIDRWSDVFSDKNIDVRRFEEAARRGLVKDFALAAGVSENVLVVEEQRSNISPSDELISIVRYLNVVERSVNQLDWLNFIRCSDRGVFERVRRRLLRERPTIRILPSLIKVGIISQRVMHVEIPERLHQLIKSYGKAYERYFID